jgi:hypothetical protein
MPQAPFFATLTSERPPSAVPRYSGCVRRPRPRVDFGHSRTRLIIGLLSVALAALSVADAQTGPVRQTPYTIELKNVADRIVKYRTDRDQLDQDYEHLKQELAKVIISSSKSTDHGVNDAMKI